MSKQSSYKIKKEKGKRKMEKVKVKWVPSSHEKYYFLDDEIDVVTTFFSDNSVNRNRIKVGNYFKTREDAEEKLEKIKEVLREGVE